MPEFHRDYSVGPGYHLAPLAIRMITIAITALVFTIIVIWYVLP